MPQVPRPRAANPKASTPPPTDTTDTTESRGSAQPPPPPPPPRSPTDAKLAASILQMYEGVAVLAGGFGIPRAMRTGDDRLLVLSAHLMEPRTAEVDGVVRVVDQRTGAEAITDAWMTAADRNPKIKAALRRFTEGGAIAEVVALHLPLVIPFLPGIPGLAILRRSAPAPTTANGAGVPGI